MRGIPRRETRPVETSGAQTVSLGQLIACVNLGDNQEAFKQLAYPEWAEIARACGEPTVQARLTALEGYETRVQDRARWSQVQQLQVIADAAEGGSRIGLIAALVRLESYLYGLGAEGRSRLDINSEYGAGLLAKVAPLIRAEHAALCREALRSPDAFSQLVSFHRAQGPYVLLAAELLKRYGIQLEHPEEWSYLVALWWPSATLRDFGAGSWLWEEDKYQIGRPRREAARALLLAKTKGQEKAALKLIALLVSHCNNGTRPAIQATTELGPQALLKLETRAQKLRARLQAEVREQQKRPAEVPPVLVTEQMGAAEVAARD